MPSRQLRSKIRKALRRGAQPLEIARKFGLTLLTVAAALLPVSAWDCLSR